MRISDWSSDVCSSDLPFEDPTETLKGFSFQQTSGVDETLESVIRLLRDELPARGFDPMRDVQVAASMRGGVVGIHALNTAIKGALYPSAADPFPGQLRKPPFTAGHQLGNA